MDEHVMNFGVNLFLTSSRLLLPLFSARSSLPEPIRLQIQSRINELHDALEKLDPEKQEHGKPKAIASRREALPQTPATTEIN